MKVALIIDESGVDLIDTALRFEELRCRELASEPTPAAYEWSERMEKVKALRESAVTMPIQMPFRDVANEKDKSAIMAQRSRSFWEVPE